jgi:membrane protease YdiL (CAAX protease family)
VTFANIILSELVVALVAKRVFFPALAFGEVMRFPMVAFAAQMLAYLLTIPFMYVRATRNTQVGFSAAMRWNWPRAWYVYVLLGIGFCLALQLIASRLPMPRENEMEIFFRTPLRAWTLSICGMSLVPIFEELFFRGFLYPVLARRLGIVIAVVLTAVAFTMIHAPQLADPKMPFAKSWGAIVVIAIIGFALTIVRAVRKSVSAGILMHMSYNGFTSLLAIISTGGFRHLERLTH